MKRKPVDSTENSRKQPKLSIFAAGRPETYDQAWAWFMSYGTIFYYKALGKWLSIFNGIAVSKLDLHDLREHWEKRQAKLKHDGNTTKFVILVQVVWDKMKAERENPKRRVNQNLYIGFDRHLNDLFAQCKTLWATVKYPCLVSELSSSSLEAPLLRSNRVQWVRIQCEPVKGSFFSSDLRVTLVDSIPAPLDMSSVRAREYFPSNPFPFPPNKFMGTTKPHVYGYLDYDPIDIRVSRDTEGDWFYVGHLQVQCFASLVFERCTNETRTVLTNHTTLPMDLIELVTKCNSVRDFVTR
jgi:hypothetical protein